MTSPIANPRDPNTLSNYHNWRISHTTTNFDIDFENNFLRGNVVLQLKTTRPDEKPEIVLDTSYLDLGVVKLNGQQVKHQLLSRFEPYGSALKIPVPQDLPGQEVELDVIQLSRPRSTYLHELMHQMLLD